ncbi:MAG: CusA/CzcA family heavy metal efflux RND transporter [Verrucomicrobiota bacterium]
MLDRLLEFSIRQRTVVLLMTLVLVALGVLAAVRLPLDAVPDITQPQVQINTAVEGLAPEEIERQVTFPLETEMSGIPRMTGFRSLSKPGLSQVTMIFEDGTDLYRARQLVSERLQQVKGALPPGLTPRLAPISTGLGEIFYYSVDYAPGATNRPASRRDQLMQLKLLQDYLIKPMLRQTPGIAEVNTSGGYEKVHLIQPDPDRLTQMGMTVRGLADRVAENTRNAGGGLVEIGGEQVNIRADTRAAKPEQLAAVPLKFAAGVKPVRVGDVATVGIGAGYRTGASTEMGEEALIGAAIMMAGGNSRIVSRAVAARLDEIRHKLPPGIEIRTLYDRSELVNRTLNTVGRNLTEGALLVVVILFLLLGNVRGAFLVALAIPLSMLFAVIGMVRFEIPGNLMSLGAIDFGLIIDGAVVMVENILRHLGERQHRLGRPLTAAERIPTVLSAAREVARPLFFGVLIITLVYLPILTLQGIEGKMFRPMALVVMLALGGALVLAFTLIPALCSWLLSGKVHEGDNALIRFARSLYRPILETSLRLRGWVLIPLVALLGLSALGLSRMGTEFIPQLDEGDAVLQLIKPQSTGLQSALETQKKSEQVLLAAFPEIRRIFSRMGSAEIATDPMDPGDADTYLLLKPREEWRKDQGRTPTKEALLERMQRRLEETIPGQAVLLNQPIAMRFDEIMAGARSELVCKIFGDEFPVLEQLAEKVRDILLKIPGAGDVELDKVGLTPQLEIRPNRDALQRYALQAEDVNRTVDAALAGVPVGSLQEGNRQIPVVVRLSEKERADGTLLNRLPVGTDAGGVVPLGRVASVERREQVGTIAREGGQRRVAILVNVRGRDTGGFVAEASQRIQSGIQFPEGYWFEFGGQFKNMVEARKRLAVVVPMALVIIGGVVFIALGSLRQVLLVATGIPLAVTGGIFALWIRTMPFTISAGIGFIALSGVAVLNGLILLSCFNQLREEGRSVNDAVRTGSLSRLRPVLMTALVASLGFVPMAIATGAGAEVQRPLATVVIGGILSSTLLTLGVLPALYAWIEGRSPSTSELSRAQQA